ncbi:hypothetical protein, partial [Mesorhizobium sp.]|uniref:hypothetical protein n=1 Tax=Mesorhizobium sp. TaxID=1871066 RepID=UPI00257ED01D
PAGTFSPYSDGEKGAGRELGACPATLIIGETVGYGVLLPVTIRGEVPGRVMSGSANLGAKTVRFRNKSCPLYP